MDTITFFAKEILGYQLFHLGGSAFTVGTIIYILVSSVLLVFLSGRLKKWMIAGPLAKIDSSLGTRTALGTMIRYFFVLIGVVVIIQSAGINLSSLTILAGAFGIGIGFGLQNITNNLVCGLVILIERPIKVGDRIEVGEVIGEVKIISPRATTVQSNDNISYIIPNADFITSRVINWSHSDLNVRLHVPVGVSYGSDPGQVKQLLLSAAALHHGVLKEPAPDVIFTGYGESSLNFELRIWTTDFIRQPLILKSDLYFAIWDIFQEHRIEIPFPQRDIHIKDTVGIGNISTSV